MKSLQLYISFIKHLTSLRLLKTRKRKKRMTRSILKCVKTLVWSALACGFVLLVMRKSSPLLRHKRMLEENNREYEPRSAIQQQKQLKKTESQTSCSLEWKNPLLNVTTYETFRYIIPKMHEESYDIPPESVKPIYPDPKFKLDPDRFLLPILINGPNNQLMGFREVAFTAIYLNRTLVIPKFYKHPLDRQAVFHDPLFPGHRFDIEDFCKFISCVTIDQFQRACGWKIDAMIYSSEIRPESIIQYEAWFKMKITSVKVETKKDLQEIKFLPPDPVKKGERFRKYKPEDIKKLFDSEDRCVLYPRPLYNLQIYPFQLLNTKAVRFAESFQDLKTMPEYSLLYSITKHSKSPKYIGELASQFVDTLMEGRPFLSVHWRYNADDFMKRCRPEAHETDDIRVKVCMQALRFKPIDISQAIERKIVSLRKKLKITIRDIYFASPPSEKKIIAEVKQFLGAKHKWLVRTADDVERFINKTHGACEFLHEHFNDILSTLEMEICSNSAVFLLSDRSSWSDNVYRARVVSGKEGVWPQFDNTLFQLASYNNTKVNKGRKR